MPEHWEKIYFNWLENIEDWCVSRQIVWGHRIPAWYDTKGNVYVGEVAWTFWGSKQNPQPLGELISLRKWIKK